MAEDEIEKLLREIDATQARPVEKGQPATPPARKQEESRGGGRFAFAAIAGVSLGFAAWVLGLFLPFTSAVSAGIGGAFAAFIAAFIAGPPRWFSS